MRRAPLSLATITVAAVLVATLAWPAASGSTICTRTGTNQRDRVYGSIHHDVLCLKAGRDYGNARGSNDVLKGGPDADTLVGGTGADAIHGLGGNDDLFATDSNTNDTLDGGPGRDNCYGDQGDTFLRSCEHQVRV